MAKRKKISRTKSHLTKKRLKESLKRVDGQGRNGKGLGRGASFNTYSE